MRFLIWQVWLRGVTPIVGNAKLFRREIRESNPPLLEVGIESSQPEKIKLLKLCQFCLQSRDPVFLACQIRFEPGQFRSPGGQLFIFR